MPDDVAILDAPADAGVDTSVDTSLDTSTPDTGTESTPEGTETGADAQEPTAQANLLDGGKLSAEAKATIEKIRAENPRLATQIKNALYQNEAFRKEFPGGLKEIQTMRAEIAQFGGSDGLKALHAENQEWKEIDLQFTAADPRFVENIAKQSPESFLKIAPQVFQQFEKMNPQGYSAYIAQTFVGDMTANRLPVTLELLQHHIGDNPKAQELLKGVIDYANRIDKIAKQPVDAKPKEQQPGALDTKAQEIQQREDGLRQREWVANTNKFVESLYGSELKRLTEGQKVSDDDQATIREICWSRLGNTLKNDADFNANLKRYFAANDQKGYDKYIASVYKERLPQFLRAAVGRFVKSAPKPTPVPKPATPGVITKTPATNGFSMLSAMPPVHQINTALTTKDMVARNQAVLKDGKRVQWR